MPATLPSVTVYWRPGCPFCSRLFKELKRAGVEVAAVNIWKDQVGAAIVRSVAGGNETVPTVMVASTPLVNPSVQQIVIEIQRAVNDAFSSTGLGPDD